MLTNGTKRRIDTARDILVGKLPDPKTQVEQITIALIYKFMDDMDKQAEELGGNPKFFTGEYAKYAWSKIFDPRVSGHELVGLYGEAIQRMNQNPNIPQLFRNIFKNAYLPYRDPETLKSFLKTIGEFEYDHSEKLGDAFEYLLSVMGSQGDAGQFRTPRHIIDFIVEMVDPSKHETILDPACGTAGFLISSYKHILEKNKKDGRIHLTHDQRKRLIDNFSGYDISPDMVRLSLANMYLHGFQNPKIYEYDTLTSEEKWQEVYDVILANPPFMSPKGGIKPHKRFSVQSKRSEVLFVDYIAEHLNPNGRAGIIVPEGIIFQSGTAYKKLRKMLVNNSLYAVVSLPAGVFNPYSGVKTSILLLDKNLAKKTDKILFVKVSNDGYGLGAQRREIKENDLPLALEVLKKYKQSIIERKNISFTADETQIAILVEKEKIVESGEYNLNGDRYKETLVYSGEWNFVELSEVAKISSGNSAPQGDKYFEDGKHPFYRTSDVGKLHISADLNKSVDYVNDYAVKEKKLQLYPKNTILFPKSGASTFLNHRVMLSKAGYVSSHLATIIPDKDKIKPLFLFHLLCHVDAKTLTPDQAYPSLKISSIQKIKIPLPPLDVQEQIVTELDSYQKIIEGARQVVDNYRPHIDIDPDWDMVELAKVIKISSGRFLTAKNQKEGNFPVYGGNGINGYHNDYFIEKPTIVIGRVGAYCGAVHVIRDKAWVTDNGLYITNFLQDVDIDFIAQMLKQLNINQYAKVGGQPSISQGTVLQLKIPLPDISTQKQISGNISLEQQLINSNQELINMYVQKIKNRIAKVWGEKK
jgi:type I restriction enzyme M protein